MSDKHLIARLAIYNRTPVLAVAAGYASIVQGWSWPVTGAVFLGALVTSLIPFKRDIALAVLLGLTFGWVAGLVMAAILVLFQQHIEDIGRKLWNHLEGIARLK